MDLFVLTIEDDGRHVTPFRATSADEIYAAFSPDGRWVAYTSNEAGRDEIYLEPFPTTGARWQISSDGGSHPAWSPGGREIVFLNGDGLMAAALDVTPAVRVGAPQRVVPAEALQWAQPERPSRFVLLRERNPSRPARAFHVATDWLRSRFETPAAPSAAGTPD
jgi:dipeptidyl aminopeptidase/acylaminoacyl peptidase